MRFRLQSFKLAQEEKINLCLFSDMLTSLGPDFVNFARFLPIQSVTTSAAEMFCETTPAFPPAGYDGPFLI